MPELYGLNVSDNYTTKLTEDDKRAALKANLSRIFDEVLSELFDAMVANQPMHSLHEAESVIREELTEFQTEVFKNPRKHPDRTALARREAIQVAAMAIRAIHDVCYK